MKHATQRFPRTAYAHQVWQIAHNLDRWHGRCMDQLYRMQNTGGDIRAIEELRVRAELLSELSVLLKNASSGIYEIP